MLTVAESDDDKSWQEAIGDIQLAINTTPHRVTKYSPMELMFGRVSRPRNLIIAQENSADNPEIQINQIREHAGREIEKTALYNKALFDRNKAKIIPFSVGDIVLLKNEERQQTKLDPKYKGPFKIKKILDNDRYEIESVNGRKIYKYPHDRLRRAPAATYQNPILTVNDEDEIPHNNVPPNT